MKYVTLKNGVKMPIVGLGTFKAENGDEAYEATLEALKAGYRHIDTAQGYENEESIGQAIIDSKIDRKDIFITTKLYPAKLGYNSAIRNLKESLNRLKTDYVDLYLIHWPSPNYNLNLETWQAFVKLYNDGLVKAIGVSNFEIHHLEHLINSTDVIPMVNQVELHPYLNQRNLEKYLKKHDIVLESYGPFAKGLVFEDEILKKIALKYNKSVANIVVRYGIQRNVVMISKSVTKNRIIDNFNVFDFSLNEEEAKMIDSLNLGKRVYTDPNNCPFVKGDEE